MSPMIAQRFCSMKARVGAFALHQADVDRSGEDTRDRLLLRCRVEVPVTTPLLFGAVARPLIDQPLVGALAGTGRNKTVAETMKTRQHFPF
jgi:hypothetical protein